VVAGDTTIAVEVDVLTGEVVDVGTIVVATRVVEAFVAAGVDTRST
jgi:hypothetical protein